MKDPYSNLQKVDFADLSKIQCDIFFGEVKREVAYPVLVVRFTGKYRQGSAGAPDARFMFAMLEAAIGAWKCWALILDLSGLAYEWGDDIEGIWSMRLSYAWTEEGEDLIALIVGPESERALASLYYDEDLNRTSFSEPWVFRDFPSAWNYIEGELANM